MSDINTGIFALMVILLFGRFLLPGRIFSKKIISRVLIPLSLFGLWFFLIMYQAYSIEKVFTILTSSFNRSSLTQIPQGEVVAGQVIQGKFIAKENYLGIVGFRFWNFYRLNDDYLIFRIKEVGQQSWYYQNQYRADQFQPNQYFTFGFPVINESLGKEYQFEIESTKGKSENAIGISNQDPVFIAKYKYPRELVSSTTSNFVRFIIKKFTNLMQNSYFTASSYIFLLPFLLYVVFISKLGEISNRYVKSWIHFAVTERKTTSIILVYGGLLADILFVKQGDFSVFLLLSTLLFLYISYKVKIIHLFCLSLALMVLSGILMYAGPLGTSERAGAWAWIFITTWLIIHIWKTKKSY